MLLEVVLVGIPQFNGCSFDYYKTIHLGSMDLLEVLTGDEPAEDVKKDAFKKKDKKAKSVLLDWSRTTDC